MRTLILNMDENTKSSMYGMDRERFWKMFLSLHDDSVCRSEFTEKLEKGILNHHIHNKGSSFKLDRIKTRWNRLDEYPPQPFQNDGRIGTDWSCKYSIMRRQCARFFGVDPSMLPPLPRRDQNKADLQQYFLSRKPSLKVITHQ